MKVFKSIISAICLLSFSQLVQAGICDTGQIGAPYNSDGSQSKDAEDYYQMKVMRGICSDPGLSSGNNYSTCMSLQIKEYCGFVPQTANSEKSDIIELQKKLQKAGYDPGPIDGIMGATTQRALDAYNRDGK